MNNKAYDFWKKVQNSIADHNKLPGISLTLIIAPPRSGKTTFFVNYIAPHIDGDMLYVTYNQPSAEHVERKVRVDGKIIKCKGVSDALCAYGFDLIYFDDIIKDITICKSVVAMNYINNFFDDSFTHLWPKGNVVVACTRFGENDIVRHILKKSREKAFNLKIIHIPYEAGEHDFCGRDIGQPLFSNKYNWLPNLKITLGAIYYEMLYNGRV